MGRKQNDYFLLRRLKTRHGSLAYAIALPERMLENNLIGITMAKIEIHGIANCDTVKKARGWLEGKGLEYVFPV